MWVNESRRTIIILSKKFLTSIWSQPEFRSGYQEAKLIFILYGDTCIDDLDDELKAWVRKYPSIKWGDPKFWTKLRYAMPHILRRNDNVFDEIELK